MPDNQINQNPFLGYSGTDTLPAISVLGFLANVIGNTDVDGLTLPQGECLGLSLILRACEQALQKANE
ncbi:MAG: hypothetical protein RIR18_661 [Pseudomonadota bacterium]|jgi:hypothetical protein